MTAERLHELRRLNTTTRSMERCGKWLAFCLKIGWPKTALDKLEGLWWEHHDQYGNLTKEQTNEQR
jgi:hypothetical protein